MNEQRDNMSLDEVTICAMLSDILNTVEFEQLKYKGQMLHNYKTEVPDNLNLDNFKDPNYLINKISEVKRTKDYTIGNIENLEDLFLCFLSDMDYRELEAELANFLNENYYKKGNPITNRMLHSQQVMLITGLISKSKEISEGEKNPLLCMASALVHDIGHVPGAHPTEEILGTFDGFFSHEINGRNVIERIITKDEDLILETIKDYYKNLGAYYSDEHIKKYIQKNKIQIKKAIEAHSRTNSEKRGDGTVVQLPREADKICYCVSDIVDVIKKYNQNKKTVEFYPEEWKRDIVKKLGKGYEEREEEIRKKVNDIEYKIKHNNFGELATSIANTVKEDVKDGKTYYDVDQDTWDILDGMIKYIKNLRTTEKIDNRRPQLKLAATYFIVKTFNECLNDSEGNVEKAWDKALEIITKSNDLDILNCINDLKERFNNSEEARKKAFEEGGILDTSVIRTLDNSNRQIKIQPNGKFQMTDLQPYLGTTYETLTPEYILDTYFNNEDGISLCLREFMGANKKSLIVKRCRNKDGVSQLEREKYVSTSDSESTLEELIDKFKMEHPEISLQVPIGIPKCQIETIRNISENEYGIVIRRDISAALTPNGKVLMPETIEVECKDREALKKVRKQISGFLSTQNIGEDVFTKETKENQAMRLIKEQENKDVEGR